MNILLRKAKPKDYDKVLNVESKSTPNLQYLPYVWDMFLSDDKGDFSVVEMDGEIVACGKYTIVPDGSAWLETLRVTPERQGLGVGKRLYEHWLKLAKRQGVKTMRMYTTITNVVSKGLAERYGLTLTQTFKGASIQCKSEATNECSESFQPVNDPKKATALLMPLGDEWGGFLVMNRTFYSLTPHLCADFTKKRMVYEDPKSGSVIALGARFMPEQAIHIGAFGGDPDACLRFSKSEAIKRRAGHLSCLFPSTSTKIQNTLTRCGFTPDKSEYIVMGINLE